MSPTAPASGAAPAGAGLEPDVCYRAVESRDRRFDGVFWTAVRSTGIYCRPSCPARTPARRNVAFHASAAAAQRAGFRACKRCLPDAVPGSPAWDVRADVAGRAMRLIGDGLVDREGVDGLAAALGYTPRHVARVLTAELGAGPLALARARRAQTARTLLEGSSLPVSDVAFAAGFASLRQFNATVREVYDAAPRELRGRAGVRNAAGALGLRVAVRAPYAAEALLAFLAEHVVAGVETVTGTVYARSLDLPHGPAVLAVDLAPEPGGRAGASRSVVRQVPVTAWLSDLRDTGTLVERVRRLLDADADPDALDAQLGADPLLAPLVAATPGLRVPGAVDGAELAVRAVVGQQVSVAGARTVTGRMVAEHGRPLPDA
ncbi:MAG TPA: AlkA N-terminal domain-containing protein, partial [Nocardioides sp.]